LETLNLDLGKLVRLSNVPNGVNGRVEPEKLTWLFLEANFRLQDHIFCLWISRLLFCV